ncbi:MAG: hypothetical protein K4304_04850 [Propionicimonas sp.]
MSQDLLPEGEGLVWIQSAPRAWGGSVDAELQQRLLAAQPGEVVAMPVVGKPPWIVVCFDFDQVLVSHWPGRLLRVKLEQPSSPEIAAAVKATNAEFCSDGWCRAHSVVVLAELDPSTLFGPHGAALLPVFEVAERLNEATVEALAAARDPEASAAYQRVWNRWGANEIDDVTLLDLGRDGGSPVGHGLLVVDDLINRRAQAVPGASHFGRIDPDDPDSEELILEPSWHQAGLALIEAALALGAPGVSGEDAAILLRSWSTVFSNSGRG